MQQMRENSMSYFCPYPVKKLYIFSMRLVFSGGMYYDKADIQMKECLI